MFVENFSHTFRSFCFPHWTIQLNKYLGNSFTSQTFISLLLGVSEIISVLLASARADGCSSHIYANIQLISESVDGFRGGTPT